jgi:hypothetical protein
MRSISLGLVVTFSSIVSLVGCAAAAPPTTRAPEIAEGRAAAAQAAASSTPPTLPTEANPADPTADPPKEDSPSATDEPRDGLRKASRPPLELLTGNNVVYVFNFKDSAKGGAAKAQCDSQDDPAAARECLNTERGKIAIESVRFVKDEHGQYWWVTYNEYKGNLLKWHKIQFVPGKADADTISLSLVGKDKGIAPMAHVPASLKIELPNDYSIVVSNPEYGDLLFDAKIGLLDKDGD